MAQDAAGEIRKLLPSKRLVIGTERTVKLLKAGKLGKVFIAANCAPRVKESLTRYCAIGKAECADLALRSDELGIVCKKPFSIAVIGVLKGL